MKTEFLAQTGWHGKLNDRVLSAAFRTLEDPHSPAHSDSCLILAMFDTIVTLQTIAAFATCEAKLQNP
jgi:hypothetical protein